MPFIRNPTRSSKVNCKSMVDVGSSDVDEKDDEMQTDELEEEEGEDEEDIPLERPSKKVLFLMNRFYLFCFLLDFISFARRARHPPLLSDPRKSPIPRSHQQRSVFWMARTTMMTIAWPPHPSPRARRRPAQPSLRLRHHLAPPSARPPRSPARTRNLQRRPSPRKKANHRRLQ